MTEKLALEVKMLFEKHYVRSLINRIGIEFFSACSLDTHTAGQYHIILILGKKLPKNIEIPAEYRGLRVVTKIIRPGDPKMRAP